MTEYFFTQEQREAAHRDPVMVDLETLSTRTTAAIISIGACKFNPATMSITDTFHIVVDKQSCHEAGLHVDPETIKWWEKQSPEARAASYDCTSGVMIGEALRAFAEWCGDVEVWGNGSDFDNAILANAFAVVGIPQPWKFWNNRCYRTMKNQHPGTKLTRHGTHHNAVDDAVTQAKHLMLILKRKGDLEKLLVG